MQQDDYISVAEAADILGLTTRQTRRYKSHVRSTFAGKRLLFHRGDVTALAAQKRAELQERLEELGAHRQQPRQSKHSNNELAAYLREQVAEQKVYTERLHQQLIQAAHRIGELEAQLAQ